MVVYATEEPYFFSFVFFFFRVEIKLFVAKPVGSLFTNEEQKKAGS